MFCHQNNLEHSQGTVSERKVSQHSVGCRTETKQTQLSKKNSQQHQLCLGEIPQSAGCQVIPRRAQSACLELVHRRTASYSSAGIATGATAQTASGGSGDANERCQGEGPWLMAQEKKGTPDPGQEKKGAPCLFWLSAARRLRPLLHKLEGGGGTHINFCQSPPF